MKKLLCFVTLLLLLASPALGEGLPVLYLDASQLDYVRTRPGALTAGDAVLPVAVKYRGTYSFTFTGKRNYSLHLKNQAGESQKVSLLGLREDDDYVLLGGLSDSSRLRNPVGLALWRSLGYPAPRSAPCELVFSGYYKGIYFLFERPDRKSAGVPDYGALYRVLAAGADGLDVLAAPPGEEPRGDEWYNVGREYGGWAPLTALSRGEAALNRAAFADYYLFINLIGASDNMTKNLYLCWDGEAFYPMPWDLDAAFGRLYTAEPSDPACWYSGPLLDRLLAEEDFDALLRARWAALRDRLAPEAVMAMFNAAYDRLDEAGAWDREAERFPAYTDSVTGVTHPLDPKAELAFIRKYLTARFALVDAAYGGNP